MPPAATYTPLRVASPLIESLKLWIPIGGLMLISNLVFQSNVLAFIIFGFGLFLVGALLIHGILFLTGFSAASWGMYQLYVDYINKEPSRTEAIWLFLLCFLIGIGAGALSLRFLIHLAVHIVGILGGLFVFLDLLGIGAPFLYKGIRLNLYPTPSPTLLLVTIGAGVAGALGIFVAMKFPRTTTQWSTAFIGSFFMVLGVSQFMHWPFDIGKSYSDEASTEEIRVWTFSLSFSVLFLCMLGIYIQHRLPFQRDPGEDENDLEARRKERNPLLQTRA
mmetsp:Transcript_173/g.293  ORF Transcript_173/g.293 Transcript_173/m.293 type:complete len:277 (-) Transcript_173:516-1346(-)|eukprot:CAMPEP_0184696430 /NCGR_PEP_ID=MMETSP0313-20130426/3727_1 /TAXON_ID=2792 /ORGANISM="Porphyridium aerugineum, Strain SAG 1380-2" /LENGTH=276 /DNA_ID=CAMNT_0027155057 /DNA_START=127 /DNA_END=957 /DNA_ORIENTATION=-